MPDNDSNREICSPYRGYPLAVRIPLPRGELSDWLVAVLRGRRPPRSWPVPAMSSYPPAWEDHDLQLALWCCYELHYRGFDDVSEEWEWSPEIINFRGLLERRWLADVRCLAGDLPDVVAAEVPRTLADLVRRSAGSDLSGFLCREADHDQFAEYLAHRSVYQLKEADPHSFGVPRLCGPAKAALVEIQTDEYGCGRPQRMHAELFRATMRWLKLDDEYGHYVPVVPAVTLAISNLMSTFGLHRRWLGALLGHLAALEMTSATPPPVRLAAIPVARIFWAVELSFR